MIVSKTDDITGPVRVLGASRLKQRLMAVPDIKVTKFKGVVLYDDLSIYFSMIVFENKLLFHPLDPVN